MTRFQQSLRKRIACRALALSLPLCGGLTGCGNGGAAAQSTVDGGLDATSPGSDQTDAAFFDASADSPNSGDDATVEGAAATGNDDDASDAGPCAPSGPSPQQACYYTISLPCGATYPSEGCHLLLTDCTTLCPNFFFDCYYMECDLDSGTVTAPLPSPVTVACVTTRQKFCAF